MVMLVELAIPVLSGVSGLLGSAVIGYRMRRRAKQIKDAVKRRVQDVRDAREMRGEIKAIAAKASEIYGSVTADVDMQKAFAALERIKASIKKDLPADVTTDTK
jgi:hypothetical protein